MSLVLLLRPTYSTEGAGAVIAGGYYSGPVIVGTGVATDADDTAVGAGTAATSGTIAATEADDTAVGLSDADGASTAGADGTKYRKKKRQEPLKRFSDLADVWGLVKPEPPEVIHAVDPAEEEREEAEIVRLLLEVL